MAEQTFRSPGFFEQEVDLTQRVQGPLGTPAGVIGTAEKGPAFVPITVGSMADFKTKFGDLDSKKFGPYAVNEFLKSRDAVTYVRVLGAGSNTTSAHITDTEIKGTVRNAGFKVTPVTTTANRSPGAVHFLAARHFLSASETYGYPIFTHNDSVGNADYVNLIRGVIFTTSDARVGVLSASLDASVYLAGDYLALQGGDNIATPASASNTTGMAEKFKLIISSSDTSFGGEAPDAANGIRVLTASLNPRNKDYIRNILNTNPAKFSQEKHLLYAAFDVESELAAMSIADKSVVMMSGSGVTSPNNKAGQNFLTAFGRFDTRYTTSRTTSFISQPFGRNEYNLFHFETIDDGDYPVGKFKVSIANIRGSTDENNPYGTFTVQVRHYSDTDKSREILESFPNCDLNPSSENFVGRMIGDRKAVFNFDAIEETERKLIVTGRYPNKSNVIRIILSADLLDGNIPKECLPFGFRGLPTLKTNDNLGDGIAALKETQTRLGIHSPDTLLGRLDNESLTGSIVPPVPLRFKVTNGAVKSGTAPFVGFPGDEETVDARFYWGVKTTMVPADSTIQTTGIANAALRSNNSSEVNLGLIDQTKFLGIEKMDVLATGSQIIPLHANDLKTFNNNKFTLARVALSRLAGGSSTGTYNDTEVTGSVDPFMREAAYIRDGLIDPNKYTVNDGQGEGTNRITLATLINQTSSITFNKFTEYAKFTNIFYGGFDGLNILDRNAARLNDKATSLDSGGGANSSFTSPGASTNLAGSGKDNNGIASYKAAVDIMTDPLAVNTNILSIPGIRESFVTDHALDRNKDYGKSLLLLDIAQHDSDGNRLFDDSTASPSVSKTIAEFEGRTIDNNTSAAYFPNVVIKDDNTGANVEVPSSIAALAALAFNDKVSYPWFAPAGFNRGALDFVQNVGVRLTARDRDDLYDARINPIATFPQQGFVIFGQKTLQLAKSALDRVNVRRMLLEVKRLVTQVANGFVFEQNTPALRSKFVAQVSPLLAVVQAQSGIEQFKVVMDDSNNSQEDIESNRLNGRIVIVPTRSVEFISIDFVITNAGVSFE